MRKPARIVKNRPLHADVFQKPMLLLVAVFFAFHLLFPWRYLAYPGELFWTEQGFRFSWRVMLMEKAGYVQFKVVDSKSGRGFYVQNSDFLTGYQEKQMSFQPDMILQFAHYLKRHFENQGYYEVKVFAESYVTLNGRSGQALVDPNVDLGAQKDSFKNKTWLMPFNYEIKGI